MRSGLPTLVAAFALAGCAPALPSFAGGRTTPRDRTDLALGGAVRVPLGDIAPADPPSPPAQELLAVVRPGGAAPALLVRHGLDDAIDLGLLVSGPSLSGQLRGALRLGPLRLLLGLAPRVGLAQADPRPGTAGGTLVGLGGRVPVTLAIDLFSIYEVWLGARAGADYATGELAVGPGELWTVSAGGVLGLAVGFRRVHVLAELAVDWERSSGTLAGASLAREGVVLTPAFAVRLRL